MHQPRKVHWTAALKIMAHVKSSPGKDLLYKKHGHVRISEYSDYAGDKGDIKNITRYFTSVRGNLVT